MAVLDDLEATKVSIATKLREVMANPLPDYSIGGQSVSRDQYYKMLLQQMKDLNELIALESAPFELRTQGVCY